MILENRKQEYEMLDIVSPILQTKEITKSTLDLLACRRKFHWVINRMLEPIRKKASLEIGDLWHSIMAAHYLEIAKIQGKLKFKPERSYGTVSEEIDKFTKESKLDDEEKLKAIELCVAGYENFKEKFDTDIEKYAVLGVEFRVSVPVPGMPDWKMSGGIDLLLGDFQTKALIIVDHKTTTKSRDDHIPKADIVFQGWDYSAILSILLGRNVEHVCFQGMRKKVPVYPEPLKSTAALSTEVTPDTTCSIFLNALKENRDHLKSIQNPDKVTQKGLSIKISDYSQIIQTLQNREDEDGNSFIWRKHGIVDSDRREMFWNDVRSKILDITDERRWSTAFDMCEHHGTICPFRNLCMYGDTPEMLMGYVQREGDINPSVKRM